MKTTPKKMGLHRRTLTSLLHNKAGNTMFIFAAAALPIIGLVGLAFDASRVYMVKARLQQACDAGALAGRRAMTTKTFDTVARTEANKFFNFNYTPAMFGTTGTNFLPAGSRDAAGGENGQVTATAVTTVPMTVLKMFGTVSIPISVTCDATLEVTNTDIMFVLDVTGSMLCAANEASCSNTEEKSTSKIKALRTAVVSFYDTVNTAINNDARLRFGFVPYSSNVNVGGILPTTYIANNYDYQTRIANYNNAAVWNNSLLPVISLPSITTPTTKATCINTTVYSDQTQTDRIATTFSAAVWLAGICVRVRTDVNQVASYKFSSWTYGKRNIATNLYKAASVNVVTAVTANSTVPIPGSYNLVQLANMVGTTGITTTSSSWGGCIEERGGSGNSYDLDIDTVPTTNTDTQWRPYWPAIFYGRSGTADSTTTTVAPAETDINGYFHPTATSNSAYIACPKAASLLTTMSASEVNNYVYGSDFKAVGGTYHDFGLIWGARLISPTGIFGAANVTAPNGRPINRHIIFMTDGDMSPNSNVYGMYGMQKLNQRISGSDLKAAHNERFSAICQAIKAKNITIWVVAYAQAMTDELEDCADPGKAFYASNDAALRAQFQQIASKIAELRLTR